MEFRTGASFPMKDLGDADLTTGIGFEGVFSYRLMPHLSVYGGWSWTKFMAENSFAGSDMDFEETGYTFGLKFVHPIGESRLSYLIAGGGTYNHIEVENAEGEMISDSGHGMGWQIEGGIVVPIGESVNLVPGVRYRSLTRSIPNGGTDVPVQLSYISLGVGVMWSL